jgi:hypothetical protein
MDTLMKMALSGYVIANALYIILHKTRDQRARAWAFGVIGLILGYWLR